MVRARQCALGSAGPSGHAPRWHVRHRPAVLPGHLVGIGRCAPYSSFKASHVDGFPARSPSGAAVRTRVRGGGSEGSSGGGGSPDPEQRRERDVALVAFIALALTLATTAAAALWRDQIGDLLFDLEFGDRSGDASAAAPASLLSGLGAGDAAGALLWAASLWFVSPLQLLLLFLGRIETERPSDWFMGLLGRAAGLSVDDVGYATPSWLRALTAACCLASGAGIAALSALALGDGTWAMSSGIGALAAAGVYEIGRPPRLSPEEAQKLEGQWQEFARFAERRLQRGGRCHESEVFGAFRREHARYRNPDALPDSALRDMVRNWHPGAERTRTGYYRNISLAPSIDAFTGQARGTTLPAALAAQAGGPGPRPPPAQQQQQQQQLLGEEVQQQAKQQQPVVVLRQSGEDGLR